MAYLVAKIVNGQPREFLYSVDADGRGHMACTSKAGASRFDTLKEAADAAGECMDRHPARDEEYRALPERQTS